MGRRRVTSMSSPEPTARSPSASSIIRATASWTFRGSSRRLRSERPRPRSLPIAGRLACHRAEHGIATTAYVANDLVTYLGSTWRARRGNANRLPVSGVDWEQFAAAGEPAPVGDEAVDAAAFSSRCARRPGRRRPGRHLSKSHDRAWGGHHRQARGLRGHPEQARSQLSELPQDYRRRDCSRRPRGRRGHH